MKDLDQLNEQLRRYCEDDARAAYTMAQAFDKLDRDARARRVRRMLLVITAIFTGIVGLTIGGMYLT